MASRLQQRSGRLTLLILLLLIVTGSREDTPRRGGDARNVEQITVAEDQIYNEGSAAPVVLHSLVEGGLSVGSVDGGNILDARPAFSSPLGEDRLWGTLDDDLRLSSGSPGIDAGSNDNLPADRFDADDDGDTSEPLPLDMAGNVRVYDGGSGSSVVDLGPLEASAPTGPVSTEDGPVAFAEGYLLSDPHPNPANDAIELTFGVARSGPVQLAIYDILGRRVKVVFDGQFRGGAKRVLTVQLSDLGSGVYFVRLNAHSVDAAKRFVVAR